MYASGNANAFVRWSNPQTGSTFASVAMSGLNSGKVSALKVSPYTNHTVYFAGQGSGITPSLIKATSANATPTFSSLIGTGMATASAYVSCIELGTDEQNLVVTYSNYGISNVWVSSNSGSSWTAIDGNLPDMPVRWALFLPGDNTKMIIATETGVWQTDLINGASTIWNPETGFPNVRTDMLQYRSSDGLISAATHGRGLFTSYLSAGPPSCGDVSGLTSSSITQTSATLSWSSLSGALSYDVEYKANSSSTWIIAIAGTTSPSHALSGLTAGTLYDYRVRANCSGASGNFTLGQFTTLSSPTCSIVTGLNTSAVTSSSATITWSSVSSALNYNCEYKLNSSSTWLVAASATTNLSLGLTGLTASSLYDVRVRANCSGATGAYASAQFTTSDASTCPGTYDISTNGTTSGAATVPFNTDIFGLVNPSGDNDYYKFVITTGGTITLTLTSLPANYHLRLLSSTESTLQTSNNSGTTDESITRTVTAGTYYARVYPSNSNNWHATDCYDLRVNLGTASGQELDGEKEIVPTLVKVYPNPTTDIITVYLIGDNSVKNVSLYDSAGKKIYSQRLTDMFTTLNVEKINAGVYFLIVRQEDGTTILNEKIIKQ